MKFSPARRRFSSTPVALAACALAAAAQPAWASINIDSFLTAQSVGVSGPTSSAFDATAAPEAIGGERDIEVTRTSPTGSIHVDIYSSTAEYSASFSAEGNARIIWDGPDASPAIDPVGLNELDLTQGGVNNRFEFLAGSDLGTMFYLWVWDSLGASDSIGVSIAAGSTIDLYMLPFTDFSGIDFTQIRAIGLEVTSPDGGEDSIIVNNFAVVPEVNPWLAAFALTGFAGWMSLRRKTASQT